ncbi:MAG: hypothetical protein ABI359_04250 [Ginsengibacter sp.]
MEIPFVNNRFACIVDYANINIAAIISSYLSKENCYIPIFEFPGVSVENYKPYQEDILDGNSLSRTAANRSSIIISNALSRIGGCENLILAGLSQNQKSFLDFLNHFNVIEIDAPKDIDFYLSPFFEERQSKIVCKSSQVLIGLFLALKQHCILEIREIAEDLIEPRCQKNNDIGIIIIENKLSVAPIIAINYAYSINADISIVDPLEKDGQYEVLNNIEEWQQGDDNKLSELRGMIEERIGMTRFDQYQFATFFTDGIPYSLYIDNCIPCSYVNIQLEPDLFIINNLIYQNDNQLPGAVMFSPQFFENEEIENISNCLDNEKYFVKKLVGRSATVLEFDMNLKEFPYNVFHICSHGGEIEGHRVEERFLDSDGKPHVIEYDSVLSISASSRKGLIHVQHKTYFKKFDGFVWKSQELKKQNYPQSVFADMQNAMDKSASSQKKIIGDRHKIPNSCGVRCFDSIHQGMIGHLASHSSPIVFNNSCWSWYNIAENFLVGGARGYIGTLWAVENEVAVNFCDRVLQANIFG